VVRIKIIETLREKMSGTYSPGIMSSSTKIPLPQYSRHDVACGSGGVVRPCARLAGRPVSSPAGRHPVAPYPFGTATHVERPRPVRRGARGDPQGVWWGALLAVGRRLAPRATGAAVDGGLRALRRSPNVARVRRCVRSPVSRCGAWRGRRTRQGARP